MDESTLDCALADAAPLGMFTGRQTTCLLLAGLLLVAARPCFADEHSSSRERQANLDTVKAAMEPGAQPPLAEPLFPARHPYPELGPPGPYFPERAQRLRQGGVAIIQCHAANNGVLTDCTAIADGPLDWGFREAALRMAEVGYLTVRPVEGRIDGALVRLIVVFPRPR